MTFISVSLLRHTLSSLSPNLDIYAPAISYITRTTIAEDRSKIGSSIAGNYDCQTDHWARECCFCKPNGVRSTQVAIWIPATRNRNGTQHVRIRNVVSRSSQADGINLHGAMSDVVVENCHMSNTGDDIFVLWGAKLDPEGVSFRNCTAVNPGIMRPNWYGNCAALYGAKSVSFDNLTCRAPTPAHPLPQPYNQPTRIDQSMFVFYSSFGGTYPRGNRVDIRGWTFTDLNGHKYTASSGSMGKAVVGKMVWTQPDPGKGDEPAPFYFPSHAQQINVYAQAP